MAPVLETTLLGLTSGITDVAPLSSEAHVALARLLAGLEVGSFEAWMMRVGTWLAVVLFFRREAALALREGLRGIRRPALLRETPPGRDAVLAVVASGATGIVAFALRGHVTAWGADPMLVGGGLFASATVLASTVWAPSGEHEGPTLRGAILVGTAGGAAMLPGVSHTALTLSSLLWLGVRPARAFELCFLMWLPVGLALLCVDRGGPCSDPEVAALAVSTALGGALVALFLLRAATLRRALPAFSLYLAPLALATMAWAYARP